MARGAYKVSIFRASIGAWAPLADEGLNVFEKMKIASSLRICAIVFAAPGLTACAMSQGGPNGGRAIGEDQAQQHCLLYRKYAVIAQREGKDTLGREIVTFKCHPLPANVPELNRGFYDPRNSWFLEQHHDNAWPINPPASSGQ
jgi:hypothetical protein